MCNLRRSGRRPVRRDEHAVAAALLVATAIAYAVAMIVFVAPNTPLGADESIYASQVNPRVPALVFSAPRARGITYLIAPLVHLTGSTEALRLYLALIAGALLVVAFWPWLQLVRRPRIVALAAFLFAGLWTALALRRGRHAECVGGAAGGRRRRVVPAVRAALPPRVARCRARPGRHHFDAAVGCRVDRAAVARGRRDPGGARDAAALGRDHARGGASPWASLPVARNG